MGGFLDKTVCYHANIYVHDGLWRSTDDFVHCSYGILFAESTVGTIIASGLQPGQIGSREKKKKKKNSRMKKL